MHWNNRLSDYQAKKLGLGLELVVHYSVSLIIQCIKCGPNSVTSTKYTIHLKPKNNTKCLLNHHHLVKPTVSIQ